MSMTRPMANNRKKQFRDQKAGLVRKGLCRQCGQPRGTSPSRSRCRACLTKARAWSKIAMRQKRHPLSDPTRAQDRRVTRGRLGRPVAERLIQKRRPVIQTDLEYPLDQADLTGAADPLEDLP